MAESTWTKYNHYIDRLCYKGEKVIDSEVFRDLKYMVKDGHIILMSRSNGNFAIEFKRIPDLMKELEDMRSIWSSITTKKCLQTDRRKNNGKKKS